jgi:hypothetical protein
MKETKFIVICMIAGLSLLFAGFVLGTNMSPECTRKHQNFIEDGRIVIIPVGDVEGRNKYNVLFNDEDCMDSMYAEEICNGLLTDDWDYNEDLELTMPTSKGKAK